MIVKDLIDKYIKGRIWTGALRVDGGWGRNKSLIQDAFPDEDILIAEASKNKSIIVSPDRDDDGPYYFVSFQGDDPGGLVSLIKTADPANEQVQEYSLVEYQAKDEGDLYRLDIKVDKGELSARIYRARWVPKFEENPDSFFRLDSIEELV